MCHAMAPAGLSNPMFGRVATGASPGAVHPLGAFANICQRNMADVQFYSLHQPSLMASDCLQEAQSIASAPTYLEGRGISCPKCRRHGNPPEHRSCVSIVVFPSKIILSLVPCRAPVAYGVGRAVMVAGHAASAVSVVMPYRQISGATRYVACRAGRGAASTPDAG